MQPADGDVDRSGAKGPVRRRMRAALPLVVACAIALSAVPLIFAGVLPSASGIVVAALVLTTLFWLIRDHLPAMLIVFVAVLLVSVVATNRLPKLRPDRMEADEGLDLAQKWEKSGRFDEKLPIVVHLVFDEMMSVGAITDDLPGGSDMRQSLLAFGEKHSFRMFDSVYSRYYFSGEALPNLVNAEYRGRTSLADIVRGQPNQVPNSAYFDDMARRGYRTVVFQSALMNFCANKNVDLCETFHSFDPGKGDVGLDARNQRASLWQAVFRAYQPSYTSEIGQALLDSIYGLRTSEVGVLGVANRYDAQRFPAWFDRFTRFATSVPRGTHIFTHFMVPHSPYLLSERCVVSGTFEGGYYLSRFPKSEQSDKRRGFYEGYFAQLGCVQSKLDEFMTAIRQSENFRDAVIIIHGDHGSRISSGNVLEDYTRRDFVDNYATFFAVRSPAAPAGLDCEFVSLPEIFRRHVAPRTDAPRAEARLPVLALSRFAGNSLVEAPMPLFGCAASPAAPEP